MKILPVHFNFNARAAIALQKEKKYSDNQTLISCNIPGNFNSLQNPHLAFCAAKRTQAANNIKKNEKPISAEKLQSIHQMLVSYQKTLPKSKETCNNYKNTDRNIQTLITALGFQRMFLGNNETKTLTFENGITAEIERDRDGNYYYRENKKETKDKLSIGKILIYNTDEEKIDNYMEGHSIIFDKSAPNGRRKIKKGISALQRRGGSEYFEEREYEPNVIDKKRPNKTNKSKRIIRFDTKTNNILSYAENAAFISCDDKSKLDYTLSERKIIFGRKSSAPESYRENTTRYEHDGTEAAERMIEFYPNGKPKYYYENWLSRKINHSDKPAITYSFKAKCLENGKWIVLD